MSDPRLTPKPLELNLLGFNRKTAILMPNHVSKPPHIHSQRVDPLHYHNLAPLEAERGEEFEVEWKPALTGISITTRGRGGFERYNPSPPSSTVDAT